MITQLVKTYLFEEKDPNGKPKLSFEEAWRYYTYVYNQKLIEVDQEEGKLKGYVEFWRINYEQFGRLICHAPFCIYEEDIATGPICYLANIYIKPEYRRRTTIKSLKRKFFAANKGAEYFVGEALRKKHKPVKVFKMQNSFIKMLNSEVTRNGSSH